MERKGFTLVEVLAVIIILALLLTLAIPSILKSRDNTLKGLSQEQERNVKKAGELVGLDLDDYMSEIYNCKSESWINDKCTRAEGKWVEVKLTMEDLRVHGYFEDEQEHCTGEITVTREGTVGYKTTLDDVTCG